MSIEKEEEEDEETRKWCATGDLYLSLFHFHFLLCIYYSVCCIESSSFLFLSFFGGEGEEKKRNKSLFCFVVSIDNFVCSVAAAVRIRRARLNYYLVFYLLLFSIFIISLAFLTNKGVAPTPGAGSAAVAPAILTRHFSSVDLVLSAIQLICIENT